MNLKSHPVLAYFLKRFATYLLTIFGSFTVAFLFFHLIPGNPIGALLNSMKQQYSYSIPNGDKMIADYEKLHLKGNKEEFEHCKPLIALLQHELKLRKQTS